jgi:hypothetical protein
MMERKRQKGRGIEGEGEKIVEREGGRKEREKSG